MSPDPMWDDDKLEELGMVRLTNKLYEEVVYPNSEKWLLVFSRDYIPGIPTVITGWNIEMQDYIRDIKTVYPDLKMAYCDVHYSGLLLKQTFDLTNIPAVRLTQYNRVYHLLDPRADNFWTIFQMLAFIKNFKE